MSIEILMPALSPTMEEGKLAKWLVKEGDEVHSGDILAEIETDKATMEFEAVDEGKIGKLLVPEGAEGIKVNQPIATLISEAAGASSLLDIASAMKAIRDAIGGAPPAARKTSASPRAQPKPNEPRTPPPTETPNPITIGPAQEAAVGRLFASPLARRVAKQRNVDLAAIRGSGPRGRIVRADVEQAKGGAIARAPAVQQQAASQSVAGLSPIPDARLYFKPDDYEELPHDSIRRTIARRLTSAKVLIPHYYLTVKCSIDNLIETRAPLKT